jgi:hypothetical protein
MGLAKQRGYKDPEAWAAKIMTQRLAKQRMEATQ